MFQDGCRTNIQLLRVTGLDSFDTVEMKFEVVIFKRSILVNPIMISACACKASIAACFNTSKIAYKQISLLDSPI